DEPHRRAGRERHRLSASVDFPATEAQAAGAAAIAAPARQVPETLDLPAIVCWTSSGSTGMRVSRERPNCPIIAISPMDGTARTLSVVWGIHCVIGEAAHEPVDI